MAHAGSPIGIFFDVQNYLFIHLPLHIMVFQLLMLAVFLSNRRILNAPGKNGGRHRYPMLSVLIPARDEERGIRQCVESLLQQDYPDFELLVLDDGSRDATRSILAGIALQDPRLQVLEGTPPTTGVSGKNWACAQLAHHSRGEILYFTDADTLHHPGALRYLVEKHLSAGAQLTTGFPEQRLVSLGERLLVPFFSWASLCFLPLAVAYRLPQPALSTAVGQVMMFARDAYFAIGGHASLGASIVDDLDLARRVKAAGFRWRLVNASRALSCRMYHSSREALAGFTKNLFNAFDARLLPYLFIFSWLAVLFLWPPAAVLLSWFGVGPGVNLGVALANLILSLLLWVLPLQYLQLPARIVLFYPLTVLAVEVAAAHSLWAALTGRAEWKGRRIEPGRWRWI